MGQLSIPTLASLKKLSALGLLVTAPLLGSSQTTEPEPNILFSFDKPVQTEEDFAILHIIDSLYQLLKPEMLEFYAPEIHKSKSIAQKCLETQQAIKDAITTRAFIPYLGLCYYDNIIINSMVDDPTEIEHILQHEMFHIHRRDKIEQNLKVYNNLPLTDMQDAYFKKSFEYYSLSYKDLLSDIFYTSSIYQTSEPECDVELEELKDEFINKASALLDTLNAENLNNLRADTTLTEDMLVVVKDLLSDVFKFTSYIITPEEFYARGRFLQLYLQLNYGIEVWQITPEDIGMLNLDDKYRDCDFLEVIDGFHIEFIAYLNALEPKVKPR